MVIAACYLLSWSRTQPAIALSSAEAEYVALAIAAQEALFIQHIATELDTSLEIRLHCDASAAFAMSEKKGVGRVRHLDLRVCFLKQLILDKKIGLQKISTTENPADVLTKPLGRDSLERCTRLTFCWPNQFYIFVGRQLYRKTAPYN